MYIYIYVIIRIGIHIRCKRMKHHCVFTARQSSNTVTSVYNCIYNLQEMRNAMPKALLCPMRYAQLLRSYPAWARINSSSISCDSSCRQQFRLIASLWAGSPRVDEVSRSITGYIYIYIYIIFLFIYTYIQYECLELPGISWIPEHHVPTRSNNIKWFQRSG